MLPEIPANEDAFARARRNLVLMSTFLLVYCTGTISFTANNAFIGFAIKIEDVFMLHAWCGVFLAYFFWRFYTAGGGGQMLLSFQGTFEAKLFRLLVKYAMEKLQKDASKSPIKEEHFLLSGAVNGVPVIGYFPNGKQSFIDVTQREELREKGRWLYYPGLLKYVVLRAYCFVREILGNNQFTELVLPWFLTLAAAGVLYLKITTY